MAIKKIDPIADLAAQVVGSDPEIQRRMKDLVLSMIRSAEDTVKRGSFADKQALWKAVVPQMMRSMQTSEQDAGETAKNEAIARMFAKMRDDERGDA